ncbi:MAG: low molecular weight protein arginine phosphatase [Thermoanaerobacteraceae bacterium]|nr:low molecular weight protein arginine phosphatase [Thermoanaerobacteraceae bacterium]
MKVLFVCTGNTCRSPMAAGILKKLLRDRGIEDVEVDSCGFVEEGVPATYYAVEVAKGHGVDIESHRSKVINKSLIDDSTIILTMSKRHRDEIIKIYPGAEEKTFTITEFAGEEGEIEDPIGMGKDVYERTFNRLYKILERIIDKMIE